MHGVDMNHSNKESFSEETNKTLSKIKHNRGMSHNIVLCSYHDNTSPGYEWLLTAWVAEERRMKSGRVYKVIITYFYIILFCFLQFNSIIIYINIKFDIFILIMQYFYDPEGNLYKTKSEVKAAWEKDGLMLID